MKIKVLNVKNDEKDVSFKVQLDQADFKKLCDKTQKEIAKDYKIAGFRKGCVPKEILAKYISQEEVKQYALSSNEFRNNFMNQIITTKEFEDARSIQFVTDFKIVDINDAKGPIMQVVFETMPKIVNINDLDLKEITLPKFQEKKRSAEDIKKELKIYLKKEAVVVDKPKKVIENNDVAVIDFKGFIDNKPFAGGEAKNYELEIGSKSFIDNFEQQLIGLKPNDKKDVFVTFPKDYHSKDYAGKQAKFEVTVHDVKSISYPEINKKFISETLNITRPDIDNEQKLIAFIQTTEQESAFNNYRDQCYQVIFETLAKKAKFNHESQGLLNFYRDNLLNSYEKQLQTKGYKDLQQYISLLSKNDKKFSEKFEEQINQQAKINLHSNLILVDLIQKMKLECSKQDLDNFCDKFIKISPHDNGQELKKQINKPENKSYYENMVLREKFFDQVLKICKFKN